MVGNMTIKVPTRTKISAVKETVRSADGTRIGFARFGKGPAIVFVHGSISGRRDWVRVAEPLAEQFTCCLMDRRGRGLSENGETEYSIEREYEDIAAVLEAAGPDASLVAHSYGATCALGAAVRTPVHRVVLYEPPLPIHSPIVGEPLEDFRRAEEATNLELALEIGLKNFVRMPAAKIEVMRKTKSWPKLAALVPTWTRELEAMDALSSSVEQYAGISAPTLLLLGSESAQHPFKDAVAELIKVIPQVEVGPLPGQSHMALRLAPHMVSEHIASFLSK